MATHSSTLAWKIPWTEEPGRLQSMRSLPDTTEQLLFHFPLSCIGEGNGNPLVFLPGESQGRGSLVGCCLWGRTGSDTTEVTQQQQQQQLRFYRKLIWHFQMTLGQLSEGEIVYGGILTSLLLLCCSMGTLLSILQERSKD